MNRVYQQRDFEVFHCLPNPIWIFDIDREAMVWANGAALKLWNADSLEALLARDFSDTSEATKERLGNYRRLFEQNESVTEQWTFYPNGNPCVVVCTCSGIPIEGDKTALLVNGRPISKTDIEPDVLRCVEAVHHTSLMVTIFSTKAELLLQNPSASRTFGPEAGGFIKRFCNPDLGESLWRRVLEGESVSVEAEFDTRSGRRWHGIDCNLTRDPLDGSKVVLCNQIDIDDLKHTELRLEKAMVKTEEMAKIKSNFLANMSHEIRTPLNGVLGMAELLAETNLSQGQRECVDHMMDAAQILRILIDDILDYSKLEAGRLTIQPQPFSLQKCFQTCAALVLPQAKAKNLQFETRCQVPADLMLVGDEVRLCQILINILGNAVKFTHRGGIQFETRLLKLEEAQCHLCFEIRDTGIGIAHDDQQKLFSRFTQLNTSLRRGQTGTGLGLAICRQLVGLMNGAIHLKSRQGKGSIFTVELTLPVNQGPVDLKTSSVTAAGPSKPFRVLLVEDNRTNQMVACRMLKKVGCQCIVANNGAEAVMVFPEQKVDLVLMDVVMPVMDGITATQKIRKLETPGVRTPIVALTANVMKEEKDRYLASDMDGFLPKPLDLKSLSALISKWWARV